MQSSALVRFVAFEKLPDSHGNAADAPVGQKWPLRHDWHAVLPGLAVNVPALQGWQIACCVVAANVPGEHGVSPTLPVGAKNPGLVGVHWLSLVRFTELENLPDGHGSAAVAPVGQ